LNPYVESLCEEGINVSATDDGRPYGMHMAELSYEYNINDVFGIPISEEWLLRFGFIEVEIDDIAPNHS
jgi:N-acetylglutamate synthase-like GNAT family acetyltransferase